MGSAASTESLIDSISDTKSDLKQFLKLFSSYAIKDADGLALRKKEWRVIDSTGGGNVSLAEIWRWIELMLLGKLKDKKAARRINSSYRQSFILAFTDAKHVSNGGTDDYVTAKEFRILVAYICIYATVMDLFTVIDGALMDQFDEAPTDKRITLEEWKEAYPALLKQNEYGLVFLDKLVKESNDKSPEDVFQEIDADGGGMILLNEFGAYVKQLEVEAKTPIGELLSLSLDSNK